MSDNTRSMDELKTLLQSCKGFSPEQRMKFYDTWAKTYEQDSEMMKYQAPNLVVDFFNAHFPGCREEARVLDVACGSGLVCKLMFALGFRRFVGVDGSQGMLDKAGETELYEDLRLSLLGTQPLPAENGAFDVVIIVGALRDGFVPVSVVRELCNAAKPGGYVCLSRVNPKSESTIPYKASLERELALMVEEGLWTHVATEEMKDYMMDVYNSYDDQQDQNFLGGTMYLFKKSDEH